MLLGLRHRLRARPGLVRRFLFTHPAAQPLEPALGIVWGFLGSEVIIQLTVNGRRRNLLSLVPASSFWLMVPPPRSSVPARVTDDGQLGQGLVQVSARAGYVLSTPCPA